MFSTLQRRRVSQVWQITILGAVASIPAAVVVNWLPNSDVTLGTAVMLIGAAIAGAVAATRSVDPGTVGLRVGLFGAVVELAVDLPSVNAIAAWPAAKFPFFVVAVVALACIASVLGWVFGRIGGRVADAVRTRRTTLD